MPDLRPVTDQELPADVRTLGRLACDAELIAAEIRRSPEQRAHYRRLAKELRMEQLAVLERLHPVDPVAICEAAMRQEAEEALYAQPPYDYANELDEGPNVSYKPNVALSEGWAHAACFAVTIAFEAGIALVGWLTWRAWPQIVAAYVWLRSVL